MDPWDEIEGCVERAVRHFGMVGGITAPDPYVAELAQRHAILCGEREFGDAIIGLRRIHSRTMSYSVLSEATRGAYRAIRALVYLETVEPSDVDPQAVRDAVAAATIMAAKLREDFERIKRGVGNA
jgi:hypothetical protein